MSVIVTVLLKSNGADKFKMPLYSDAFNDKPAEMSAEEIKQSLLKRLQE